MNLSSATLFLSLPLIFYFFCFMNIKIRYDDAGKEYIYRRALRPSSYDRLLKNIDIWKLIWFLGLPSFFHKREDNSSPGVPKHLRRDDPKKFKTAKGYKLCCPFHAENTPSFHIFDSSKKFFCYGCGASWTCIDLIKKIKGLSPLEAIGQVRKWFPIDWLEYENYRIDIASKIDEVRAALQTVLEEEKQDHARLYSRYVKRIWNEKDHDRRTEYIHELLDLWKKWPMSYQNADKIHLFQYLKSQNSDLFRLYLKCKFFEELLTRQQSLISQLTHEQQIEDFIHFCEGQEKWEEYENFYRTYFWKGIDELK